MDQEYEEFWSNVFIVTCQGYSASVWLATQLNQHFDVMCAHNVTPVVDLILIKGFEKRLHIEMSTLIEKHYRQNTDFSVSHLFALLKIVQAKKVYGNVHTFQLSNLEQADIPAHVPVVNLIRHPISTINSYFGELSKSEDESLLTDEDHSQEVLARELLNFKDQYDYIAIAKENKDRIDRLSEKDIYCFFKAVTIIEKIGKDYSEYSNIERVISAPMEKLTTDKAYFKEIFSFLTRGKVDVASDYFPIYLDNVIASEATNQHQKGKAKSPQEIYDGWQVWQQVYFCQKLEEANLRQIYLDSGYDLSYAVVDELSSKIKE